MSLFSEQEVHCNNCGRRFNTSFGLFGGRVCSMGCHRDLEWKKTLSILGKPFKPRPPEEGDDLYRVKESHARDADPTGS